MRLLAIRDSHVRYGSENQMLRVACGLAKKGVEVHAAFIKAPGTASLIHECQLAGVFYWPFDLHGTFDEGNDVRSPRVRMLDLLQAVKPNVVLVMTAWPDEIYEPSLSCATADIPLLAVFQLAPEFVSLPPEHIEQLAIARQNRQRWVAVSQQNLEALQQTFRTKPHELSIIHNGTEIDTDGSNLTEQRIMALRVGLRKELGLPLNTALLLTVARLHWAKGHSDLLDVLPRLLHNFPDIALIWAGSGGAQQTLEQIARQQHIREYVHFLGYRSDVRRLLHASDLFVFPSYAEGGCSAAIREAMASQLPIVCSNAGGIPEILAHEIHALIYSVGDAEGLLAQLFSALSDPARMRRLAQQARNRIAEFSSDRMIGDYFNALSRLCVASSDTN